MLIKYTVSSDRHLDLFIYTFLEGLIKKSDKLLGLCSEFKNVLRQTRVLNYSIYKL